jgi:DNA-binding response OmpR family regulator
MRILVLDHTTALGTAAAEHLSGHGFRVEHGSADRAGLQLAGRGPIDCLILVGNAARTDNIGPSDDIRAVCGRDLPVIVIEDSTSIERTLAWFSIGIDDHLSSRFDLRELEARIRAVHRRARHAQADHALTIADLQHNPATCQTWRAGRPVRLGRAGRQILRLLMSESPNVVSRKRLEFEIWGHKVPPRDLLRSHLSTLRLAVDGFEQQKLIHTVHRVGVRLAPPSANE